MLAAEEQYRLLQQSLVATLFYDFSYSALVTNSEHRIVWANAAFEQTYGYLIEEVIGLPSKLIHDPSLPEDAIKPAARQLLDRRKPWQGSYRNRRANGEIFTAYYVAVPLGEIATLPINGVFAVSGPESEADHLRESVLSHTVNRCIALAVTAQSNGTTGDGEPKNFSRKGQRQREIHRLTLLGYTSKEIASLMGISPSTVNVVRWKLGQTSTAKTSPQLAESKSVVLSKYYSISV